MANITQIKIVSYGMLQYDLDFYCDTFMFNWIILISHY